MKKVNVILFASASLSAKEGDKDKQKSIEKLLESPVCKGPLIVINKDVFSATELAEWEVTNVKYYCNMVLTAGDSATCKNYAVVDLSLISNHTSVASDWLEKNTDNICYKASYPIIENDHEVTKLPIIDLINKSISSGLSLHMTLEDFISKIANYDVFNYERYINFSIDPATNIPVFESYNRFAPNLYSFSLPSIKAIVAKYGIDIKDFVKYQIDLVKIEDPTTAKVTIGFKITNGAIVGYYDYSTDPSGNPPRTLRNFR